MWPDGEPSPGSEVVIIGDRSAAGAPALPLRQGAVISHLNAHRSDVHLGDNYVNITQNIHKPDVVKELSLPRYLVTLVKNSSRAERLLCTASALLVLLCVALVLYYTLRARSPADDPDVSPHEWNITREMWLAQPVAVEATTADFQPLRLVIISHTVSTPCYRFKDCAVAMRNIQSQWIHEHDYDIPYNFVIGNDGRVYEGLGWVKQGAHTRGYNRCSLGIGFVGDYREEIPFHNTVTAQQLNRTLLLLETGVRLGYLHPNYRVQGAKDLRSSASPGSSLYNAIKTWRHYDHTHQYKDLPCDQIYALPIEEADNTTNSAV